MRRVLGALGAWVAAGLTVTLDVDNRSVGVDVDESMDLDAVAAGVLTLRETWMGGGCADDDLECFGGALVDFFRGRLGARLGASDGDDCGAAAEPPPAFALAPRRPALVGRAAAGPGRVVVADAGAHAGLAAAWAASVERVGGAAALLVAADDAAAADLEARGARLHVVVVAAAIGVLAARLRAWCWWCW